MKIIGEIHKDRFGRFSTVRDGIIWSDLEIGEMIKIEHVGTEFSNICIVTNKNMREFSLVEGFLDNNFDLECRTYEGLLKRMKELYPGFKEDNIVTIVELEYYQIGHGG
jgi:hypothetical protein